MSLIFGSVGDYTVLSVLCSWSSVGRRACAGDCVRGRVWVASTL